MKQLFGVMCDDLKIEKEITEFNSELGCKKRTGRLASYIFIGFVNVIF